MERLTGQGDGGTGGRGEPRTQNSEPSQDSGPRTQDPVLVLHGQAMVPGAAEGIALVASEPLSFWGGLDPATGEVIDRRHPLSGQIVTGRVLVLPYSRGSSTTSTVLLEAIRANTAPAALVASSPDSMLALGSLVADQLYHRVVPVVALEEADYGRIQTGDRVTVYPNGTVEVAASR